MRRKILVVARDVSLRAMLARTLMSGGYAVELAGDTKRAREAVATERIDLAMVASSAPGDEDRELARELGEALGRLIIVGGQADGIGVLVDGTSVVDRVSDPSNAGEVLARVRAALDGGAPGTGVAAEPEPLAFDGFTLDLAGHALFDGNGREIPLTRSEFALLVQFVRNPGRVQSRDRLRVAVTGQDGDAYDRSIDVMVWRLRKKIEADPKSPRLIVTVPGAGYKFAVRAGSAVGVAPLDSPERSDPPSSAADRSAAVVRSQMQAAPSPAAERRQLTVMCCGLAGLTALPTSLDPEEAHAIIDGFRQCCAEIVDRFGGVLAGFSEVGAVFHFGYPQAQEDDAERAVRAGLELVRAAPALGSAVGVPLRPRVGIATSLVVASENPGHGLVVVGEASNLAPRLRSAAPSGTVLVEESTRRLIGTLFECRGSTGVETGGALIATWHVVGESGVASRFEALHSATMTPLVGREDEIELLCRLWRRAKDGRGKVVLLSGEPGIGKSRLTVALRERLHGEPHGYLGYFCSRHHEGSVLFPVINQLERAAGFTRNDAPDARLAKFDSWATTTPLLDEDAALLAELLSLPVRGRFLSPDLTPQRHRERTFEALLRRLECLAKRKPVLMVFEDAHWSDPTSLELLGLTLDCIDRLPVMLVITFRPDFVPPWTGQRHLTMLTLGRLDPRECAMLVEHVAGPKRISSQLAEEIVARTDGVPLFLEEVTKAVAELGDAKPADGAELRRAPVVPATLRASLLARLDRLGPAAKQVAQIGAAIGREFSYELVAAVADASGAELESAFVPLIGAGLALRRGVSSAAVFLFKHGLVQDAAYESMLRSKRRPLHARIAEAIARLHPKTAEQQPELLAHHFTAAGQSALALKYWRLAVERGLRTSAYREAIAHCINGIEVARSLDDGAERLSEELSLRLRQGAATIASEGPAAPAVLEVFNRARAIAEELGDERGLATTFLGLWAHFQAQAYLDPAIEFAKRLISIGERRGDDALRMQGHAASLTVTYKLGRFEQAWRHFEEGTALYRPDMRVSEAIPNYGNPGPDMLLHASFVAWVQGYPARARKLAEETIRAAQRIEQPYTTTHCVYMLGHLAELQDDWEEVRRANERTVGLATRWGFGGTLTLVRRRIALVAVALDRNEEQFRIKCRHRQPGFARSLHDVVLARMCLSLGDAEKGLLLLEEALAFSKETGSRFYDAEAYRMRGQLLAFSSRWTEAEASFLRAIEIAREQHAGMWELRAARDVARLWADRGDRQRACDLLAPVLGRFTDGFETRDLREAKAVLDEVRG
jgi:DNA-binding response OmpR family regulator/class 3 adenylate cyclase/tetratricopeptide (TPR) repeat protein